MERGERVTRSRAKQRQALGDLTNGKTDAKRKKPEAAKPDGKRPAETKRPDAKRRKSGSPWWGEQVWYKAGPTCPRGRNTAPVPSDIEDIDLRHPNDPLYCRTYVKDIHSYLRSLQFKHKIDPHYMATVQTGSSTVHRITPTMRAVLIDWLVEVAEEYMLLSDTLYLCVRYIDRVLSARRIPRPQLQLLGCACLLLAAKYEEQYAPQIDEFVLITDNSYSRNEILRMEQAVLKDLDFRLTEATAKTFLRRLQRAAFTASLEKHLSNYLAELTLMCYELVAVPPDQVAAAAVYLSRLTLYASDRPEANRIPLQSLTFKEDKDVWTPALEHYSGYTGENLSFLIRKLLELHTNAWQGEQRATYDKYSLPVFEKVAMKVQPYRGHLAPKIGKTAFALPCG